MSPTPEMLIRHRQAIARIVALQFDLHRALRAETTDVPDHMADPARTWAELLSLLPALNACLRSLNAALVDTGSLMIRTNELDRLGAELCRLHGRAARSAGAGSSELKAASKTAVEALLTSLTEWTCAAAQITETDGSLRRSVTYRFKHSPPENGVNDAAGGYGYLCRSRGYENQNGRCGLSGLILGVILGISIAGD